MGDSDQKNAVKFSVVVPLYNEAESVVLLHHRISEVLKTFERGSCEVIFVDDGSTDGTFERARWLSPLTFVRLHENYGQTAAIAAGIASARGEIIVTMDGDLENDPADIPRLLDKLEEGYDVVSGWRKERWREQPFGRRLPSALANRLISRITGVNLHDHGCTLKAYRQQFIKGLYLFGDMHRMLAAYAVSTGARLAEVPVHFSERKYGYSKYGLSRAFRVLLDIVAFHFFRRYKHRPMHFFGWFGFWSIMAGLVTFFWMIGLKIFEGKSFIATPLPILVVFFVILGAQFVLMGLLGEILIRSQYELGEKASYRIDDIIEQ